MDFEFLFQPVEAVDAWLTGLFSGAPLLVAARHRAGARPAPRLGPGPPRGGHVAGRSRRRRQPRRDAARRLVGRRATPHAARDRPAADLLQVGAARMARGGRREGGRGRDPPARRARDLQMVARATSAPTAHVPPHHARTAGRRRPRAPAAPAPRRGWPRPPPRAHAAAGLRHRRCCTAWPEPARWCCC